MSSCPICQAILDIQPHNHGTLFTCSSCHGVFFVNWDGLPEVANHEAESEILQSSAINEETPFETEAQAESEAPSVDSPAENFTHFQDQSADTFNNGTPAEPAPMDAGFETSYQEPHQPQIEAQGFAHTEPMAASDFAAEVVEFGNAEMPLEGMSYLISVSDIDTSELRSLVEEVLLDPRLKFDTAQLLEEMQNGSLNLPPVGAAKAFVLIERLQLIPVQLKWRQNV